LPKMVPMSGANVCRILAHHGFEEVRRKGSHIIMQRRTGTDTITVPVPNHDELRIGTLRSIVRQCGLPRELFES